MQSSDWNGNGLPSFSNTEPKDLSNNGDVLGRRQQAIISSYKFECTGQDLMCGNITWWGADLQPGGGGHDIDMDYNTDFQVWRPSPIVNDSTGTGCYSLVGNNRFTSISLKGAGGVAEVTPSPQDYIQFRPGDVLGVYVEEARSAADGVVALTRPRSFTSELVWYASIAPTMTNSQNRDCPYSVGSSGVLNTLTRAVPVISISTTTFICPPLPTTQSTPQLPNPIISEQPLDLLITATSINDSADKNILATDSEVAGTEQRVPPTSGTATDPRPILRPREPTDIGLIIGIVVIVIVMIAAVVTVVVIISVLFKRRGNVVVRKTGALANPAYGTKGGVSSSLKIEYNTNADYDYIEDQGSAAVYQLQEAVPYHSKGPGVSISTKTAAKTSQQGLTGNESVPDVYKAPSRQKFRRASNFELPQSEDVFDSTGFYVPTADERVAWAGNHYGMEDTGAYNKLQIFIEGQIYWAPASKTSDLYS